MTEGIPLSAPEATLLASAPLTDLVVALKDADSEPHILASAMNYLLRFEPQGARLIELHLDAHGRLIESQTVADWRHGQLLAAGADPALRGLLVGDLITHHSFGKWQEPLLLLAEQPDAATHSFAATIGCPPGCQAVALLPLRSGEGQGAWHGLFAIYFESPHSFSVEERDAYRLLMALLAGAVSGLRSRHALLNALREAEDLHHITQKLNAAMTQEEVLRTMLTPAPLAEEAEVSLCSIENDSDGKPAWLTVESTYCAEGRTPLAAIGMRYYLPDIPFAKLYTSSPDIPLLISDIENDPRVDDVARGLYQQTQCKSTIVMSLTLQGRWVGLFNISWQRKVKLGAREQRLYQAMAKQAALLLDNNLMMERLRRSLKETQQQSSLMQTILDHLPVGVVLLAAPTNKPLLSNAHLERMLGRHFDMSPEPNDPAGSYKFVAPGGETLLASEELPGFRATATGQMQRGEFDILKPDGERVSVEVTAVPITDERGAPKSTIVLLGDLTNRKRAEQERTRLQEEVIRVQAAALAERSSPLIPITDDILVLPLIGSIDTERGQQVIDTVLHGTSQRGAKVAILDITGVRTIDTQAASALTNAAHALRLLGVEPVLTGIRPEVAQTLIGLGIQLEGIVTRSTLQSGIQYALRRLGKPAIG